MENNYKYISSTGEEKDVREFDYQYLVNALAKAYRNIIETQAKDEFKKNSDNIVALQNELAARVNKYYDEKFRSEDKEMLEKKVYSSWAFKEHEQEKSKINHQIYDELKNKYKISNSLQKYNSETKQMEDINFDDYDLVYERIAGYNHADYYIKKNTTDMTADELALIFDHGNLCFGYNKESENHYYVFED